MARRTWKPASFFSSATGLLKSGTFIGSRHGFMNRLWKPGPGTMWTLRSGLASNRSVSSAAIGLPPMSWMSPASMAAATGSGSMIGMMTTLSSFGRSGS